MIDDTLPVMLEPVGNQNRLSVCRFNQIFEGFELVVMDDSCLAILVIDSTIAHL